MSFAREKFYGVNWFWYAIDCEGYIGIFTSGYSPIPKAIFTDNTEERYEELMRPMYQLKEDKESCLAERKQCEQESGISDYSEQLLDAKMGLFVYEGDDGPYELVAYSNEPIHVSNIPESTAKEISKVCFSGLRFSNASVINVEDYFEC
jgi:hypothetical protein